jgi:hypothetical protein
LVARVSGLFDELEAASLLRVCVCKSVRLRAVFLHRTKESNLRGFTVLLPKIEEHAFGLEVRAFRSDFSITLSFNTYLTSSRFGEQILYVGA